MDRGLGRARRREAGWMLLNLGISLRVPAAPGGPRGEPARPALAPDHTRGHHLSWVGLEEALSQGDAGAQTASGYLAEVEKAAEANARPLRVLRRWCWKFGSEALFRQRHRFIATGRSRRGPSANAPPAGRAGCRRCGGRPGGRVSAWRVTAANGDAADLLRFARLTGKTCGGLQARRELVACPPDLRPEARLSPRSAAARRRTPTSAQRVREILARPDFRNIPGTDIAEYREIVLRWCHVLADEGIGTWRCRWYAARGFREIRRGVRDDRDARHQPDDQVHRAVRAVAGQRVAAGHRETSPKILRDIGISKWPGCLR